jgi:hypothetical protein
MDHYTATDRGHAHGIPFSEERLIINRLIVELNLIGRTLPDGPTLPIDFVIALAVSVGTLERRPLGAHKIAQCLRLPKGTVARRLNRLLAYGVRRQGTAYTQRTSAYLQRTPHAQRAVRLVMQAARELAALGH